jgi:hypothetical protein
MLKKVLKMNQVVARIAEELVNNSVTVETLVTEKNVQCLRLFAQLVVKRQLFLLSLLATDLYIAEIVSRQNVAATTKIISA